MRFKLCLPILLFFALSCSHFKKDHHRKLTNTEFDEHLKNLDSHFISILKQDSLDSDQIQKLNDLIDGIYNKTTTQTDRSIKVLRDSNLDNVETIKIRTVQNQSLFTYLLLGLIKNIENSKINNPRLRRSAKSLNLHIQKLFLSLDSEALPYIIHFLKEMEKQNFMIFSFVGAGKVSNRIDWNKLPTIEFRDMATLKFDQEKSLGYKVASKLFDIIILLGKHASDDTRQVIHGYFEKDVTAILKTKNIHSMTFPFKSSDEKTDPLHIRIKHTSQDTAPYFKLLLNTMGNIASLKTLQLLIDLTTSQRIHYTTLTTALSLGGPVFISYAIKRFKDIDPSARKFFLMALIKLAKKDQIKSKLKLIQTNELFHFKSHKETKEINVKMGIDQLKSHEITSEYQSLLEQLEENIQPGTTIYYVREKVTQE